MPISANFSEMFFFVYLTFIAHIRYVLTVAGLRLRVRVRVRVCVLGFSSLLLFLLLT